MHYDNNNLNSIHNHNNNSLRGFRNKINFNPHHFLHAINLSSMIKLKGHSHNSQYKDHNRKKHLPEPLYLRNESQTKTFTIAMMLISPHPRLLHTLILR